MIGRALLLIAAVGMAGCTRPVPGARVPNAAYPRAVARRPGALPPTLERQVRNAVDAGDGDARVRLLRQRLAADPGSLPLRLELASRYYAAGYPDIALEHYRLAAERFPDNAEVAALAIGALRDLDQVPEAMQWARRFVSLHPGAAPVHAWLGILLDEAGELALAEREHRAAVAAEPGHDAYYNNLGYNLLLQGRRQEAAEEFRRALALNRNSVIARNNLGITLADQPDQAVSQWRLAADTAAAYNNLAAVRIEQGKYAEARQQLERALREPGDHTAALRNLKLLASLDGKPVTAPLGPRLTVWQRFWSAVLGLPRKTSEPGNTTIKAGVETARSGEDSPEKSQE